MFFFPLRFLEELALLKKSVKLINPRSPTILVCLSISSQWKLLIGQYYCPNNLLRLEVWKLVSEAAILLLLFFSHFFTNFFHLLGNLPGMLAHPLSARDQHQLPLHEVHVVGGCQQLLLVLFRDDQEAVLVCVDELT